MPTVLSKLLVFGVVVAAGVGVSALPASATSTDEVGSSAQVADFEVGGTFKVHEGIDLGPGKVRGNNAKIFEIRRDANNVPVSLYIRASFERLFDARAVFPIREHGQDTGYWLRAGAYTPSPYIVRGVCEVFEGEPRRDAQPVWTSPFSCQTKAHFAANDFDFIVGLNRDAEVSGSVGTASSLPDAVSLTAGRYETDQQHHRDGAADLTAGSSRARTTFSAVAVEGDTRHWDAKYNDQARMEFSYQIVDQGNPTGYYLAGMVSNHRGALWFSADAHCEIYAVSPLGEGKRLDDHTPVDDSPYTCSQEGHVVTGDTESGNGHYHADFTVGRR